MPAKPRWLLSIPDAISQLEQLDRTLLTRRDIERPFGVFQGPRRRAHADLRGRDDRQPTDPDPDEAPAPAARPTELGSLPVTQSSILSSTRKLDPWSPGPTAQRQSHSQ